MAGLTIVGTFSSYIIQQRCPFLTWKNTFSYLTEYNLSIKKNPINGAQKKNKLKQNSLNELSENWFLFARLI